jgi:hypothetical protein
MTAFQIILLLLFCLFGLMIFVKLSDINENLEIMIRELRRLQFPSKHSVEQSLLNEYNRYRG